MKRCRAPLNLILRANQSARGLAHSRTLPRIMEPTKVRQVLECASPLALWEIALFRHHYVIADNKFGFVMGASAFSLNNFGRKLACRELQNFQRIVLQFDCP